MKVPRFPCLYGTVNKSPPVMFGRRDQVFSLSSNFKELSAFQEAFLNPPLQLLSLIMQGIDGIQLRGSPGRPEAEAQAHYGAEDDPHEGPFQRHMGGEVGQQAGDVAEAKSHGDADDAPDIA